MLIEASINDLITSTNQIDTPARQHISNQVHFQNGYQVVPTGADVIFSGQTQNGHNPKIRVVGFTKGEGPDSIQVVVPGGKPISMLPIAPTDRVFVTCDCEDFVFRFATTNQQRGVLFGKITSPYIPKTNRATQNLGKIGVCKHLIGFIDLLKNERIVK